MNPEIIEIGRNMYLRAGTYWAGNFRKTAEHYRMTCR